MYVCGEYRPKYWLYRAARLGTLLFGERGGQSLAILGGKNMVCRKPSRADGKRPKWGVRGTTNAVVVSLAELVLPGKKARG